MIYPKVLIVATSKRTRGGITSVVKAHKSGDHWKQHHCRWIQTHRDGSLIFKLGYFILALLEYFILLPFYDIIHIHLASGPISAFRKHIFIKIAKLFKKKIIIHYHPSSEKWLFQPLYKSFYKKLFLQADLIIVLSEQWKKWLMEALELTEKIKILYNPCPLVNRREDLREKNILFAGTLIMRKGYADLIHAFAKVAHKYPDWKIIFAGNGEIKEAREIVRQCRLSSQVIFLGWISGKDKEREFQKASIYCLASEGEGFPMGILDAWAYGVPCIATPVGGIPDIVIDGVNGLLFNKGDIESFAIQLERLIINEELRRKIVKETDQCVCNKFNVNSINQELHNIYLKL